VFLLVLYRNYTSKGSRNQGGPLKRPVVVWDRNGTTRGRTPW